MTTPNQDFDKKLNELKSQLIKVQEEIKKVEKEKEEERAIKNYRTDFLNNNSVFVKEVSLEFNDNHFFIIGKDKDLAYILKLEKKEAEKLADYLDYELGKAQINNLLEREIIENMFGPLFKKD